MIVDRKKAIGLAMRSAAAFWAMNRLAPLSAAQCPMCRTALLNSAEGQQLAASFNGAILLLLAVPASIVLGVALLLWRARRKRPRAATSAVVSRAGFPPGPALPASVPSVELRPPAA